MNLLGSQRPTLMQSFFEGLCIQIRMPSIAPAQQLKSAFDTFSKPRAISLCLSRSVGYSMLKFARMLIDCINHIPEAIYSISVTNTACNANCGSRRIFLTRRPKYQGALVYSQRGGGSIWPASSLEYFLSINYGMR